MTRRHDPEPTDEPTELIHPYIMQALQDARAGDLDALAWLQSDCTSWGLIEPNAAALIGKIIANPGKRYRYPRNAQNAPGRAQQTAGGRITAQPVAESHRAPAAMAAD